jgi:hypothetical protein
MTPKEKAISLVDSYRMILMNEDTECGEEILCTVIAKQCALIAVDELIKEERKTDDYYEIGSYWRQVKKEIKKL